MDYSGRNDIDMTQIRNYPEEHQAVLKSARVSFVASAFSTGHFWLFKDSDFIQTYQLKAVDALFQANASAATGIFLLFILIILNLILAITGLLLNMDSDVLKIVFFLFCFHHNLAPSLFI